ncbi:MAG: TonB family protein [Holophagales bacterium]|nr:TonB family protein [Holophagales bacterium]MBK9966869.1 TonB family protein [Holophagales bacterium]
MRVEPSLTGAIVGLLPRGSEVELQAAEGAFVRVAAKGGRSGWLEAGTFETAPEQEARERRTKAVGGFAPIEGRIVAPCPVYLAPDFGAARWGELEEGDPVEVVIAEHDFLGVRLLGIPLAFVPAHAVRYLAAPPPTPAVPEPAAVEPPDRPGPGAGVNARAGAPEPSPDEAAAPSAEPYAALPFGAEPPVLQTRVEPQYPSAARKAGIGGEVVLQVVVERDGTIGSAFAVQEAPMGLTAAATDAVRRWVYAPARLDGRPIAVVKTVRVRFTPAAP